MALSALMMIKVCRFLKEGDRVAAMGYPDIIGTETQIEEILKGREVAYRPDSEAICKRHGLAQRKIPDAESFFHSLGARLDVFDIIKERGTEILCDLNKPFVEKESYEMVLDVGTLEHCFNVGQAMMNMAGLLKKGGMIFHQNPFNLGNHGFYGFNPTFYQDFYEQNGFSVLDNRLVNKLMSLKVPATGRFVYEQKEAGTFCIARREEVKEFVFPTQTKYKQKLG